MPGWSVDVLRDDADETVPAEVAGRIAIDLTASALAWFRGYVDEPDRTTEKFSNSGRWYRTGDTGSCDDDGYFRFSSPDDDVIIMAGYRIGPFDVESVLTKHPAVAECAVIAAPDQIRSEVLEAYVVLLPAQTVEPAELHSGSAKATARTRFLGLSISYRSCGRPRARRCNATLSASGGAANWQVSQPARNTFAPRERPPRVRVAQAA